MHEKHIIDDLMKKILAEAKQAKAVKVSKISVWLGILSHMSPSHFREHFEMSAQNSIAEHARIEIETSNDMHHPHANRIILKSIEFS